MRRIVHATNCPRRIVRATNCPVTQKAHRKKFTHWARKRFPKEDTLRIVFSDEKMFDLDGIYNSKNDRIWAVNRKEENRRGRKNSKGSVQKK